MSLKKIIYISMIFSIIGCLTLWNSLANAYAQEAEDINYSINLYL